MTRAEKLDFLIQYLSKKSDIPTDYNDKWRLFRSLVNIREPDPIGEEFLKVQDEFLKEEIALKGVTDIKTLKPVQNNLYIFKGDITTLNSQAIVNAANSKMLGCFYPCHGCIDNAIHTYAGVQLRLECYKIMSEQCYDEPVGSAKITGAYNLPSEYIIHTVGPVVNTFLTKKHCEQLKSCYKSCLELADKYSIKSIAFCCIHFPNKKAAEIAVKTVKDHISQTGSKIKVIFNVFKETDYDIYRKLLLEN